jgi:serine/threonine protein kinase
VIYDGEGKIPWARRERWAKQIVQGLSEIHEAGFVQGDFTLSNIVIDNDDNAKIIDINRRGCPVGWEPPEVVALIDSNQRISMYIGVKSDLFQLGMVLYALATQQDEPENQRPLDLERFPAEIPGYYVDVCRRCLNNDPRQRSHAAVLVGLFPCVEETTIVRVEPSVPIPIIVDARHGDDLFPDDCFSSEKPSALRKPSYQYSPGYRPLRGRGYAETDVTEDSEYFFPRGRSPPRRYEITPSDIPLPPSHTEFEIEYLDSTRDSTPTQYRLTTETGPDPAAPKELDGWPQDIDVEAREAIPHTTEAEALPQSPADGGAEEPRTTAAAKTSVTYPADLVGIGGVYGGADVEIPTANLDDDLTTDTTDKQHVLDSLEGSIGLA